MPWRADSLPRRRFLHLTAATMLSGAWLAGCEPLVGPTMSAPGDDQLGPHRMLVGGLDQRRSLVYYPTEDERRVTNGRSQSCGDDTTASYPPLTEQLLVPAAVYYPYNGTPRDDIAHTIDRGPFPVILFAHAYRGLDTACFFHPGVGYETISQDYQLVGGRLLLHLVSHGAVVVVPDLSRFAALQDFSPYVSRAQVLLAYLAHLTSINSTVFASQLDFKRQMLIGHSTGGGACLAALRGNGVFSIADNVKAVGLLAPAGKAAGADSSVIEVAGTVVPAGLLVLKGSLDTRQVHTDPESIYQSGHAPKAFVTIEGANHFGYTNLCSQDNKCEAFDPKGTITTQQQQTVAGVYLGALFRRFVLNDPSVSPLLQGAEQVAGLPDVQVSAEGM